MPQRSAQRRPHQRSRPLLLEPLEQRAMCAAAPFHTVIPEASVYGAIHRSDGSIEVIGVRESHLLMPLNAPVGGVVFPETEPFIPNVRYIPLTKWTVSPDGSVDGGVSFDLPANATNGFLGIFSPDGSWLAGNQAPTRRGASGLSIIWRPGEDNEIVVATPQGRPADRAIIHAVANDGTVIASSDGEFFAWNQTTGLLSLRSLYDLEGNQAPSAKQFMLSAISADGQTIVGASGSAKLPYRPTVWRNGVASALPTGPYSVGFVTNVSAGGRVIGGNLRDGFKMIPAVWVDGILQPIGQPDVGFSESALILGVVQGLAGDPAGWAAIGSDSGRNFITRSDGIFHDFWTDDPDSFGLPLFGNVRHFSADVDSLDLVTSEYVAPATSDCFGYYCETSPTILGHALSIPLYPTPESADHYDLNGDLQVSPIDALIVINALNEHPGASLASLPELRQTYPKIDTNGDGELTPIDALRIINFLNELQPAPGSSAANQTAEGEAAPPSGFAAAADEYFFSLSQPSRRVRKRQVPATNATAING